MPQPYSIKVSPTAVNQFKKLLAKYQKLLIKQMDILAINPRPADAKKINGMTGLYSHPVQSLRLIYKIEDQEILILLIK